MSMRKLLNMAKKITFSGQDIYDMLGGNCLVLRYKDLAKIDDIDELLDQPCVILYETAENFGHWTLLLKIHPIGSKTPTLELFDSYAYRPDDQIKFIPENYRNGKTAYPHLSWLVANSGYKKILHNNVRLQKVARDVNTCGRYVALRAKMWQDFKVPLKKFINMFKNKYGSLDSDDLVTLMTIFLGEGK